MGARGTVIDSLLVTAAGAVLVGASLDWFVGANSLEVPIQFMWDPYVYDGPGVGYILFVVAIGLFVTAVRPRLRRWVSLLGLVPLLVAILFFVSIYRYDAGFYFDEYGLGMWLTAAAGIFTLVLARRRGTSE